MCYDSPTSMMLPTNTVNTLLECSVVGRSMASFWPLAAVGANKQRLLCMLFYFLRVIAELKRCRVHITNCLNDVIDEWLSSVEINPS
jgi:hypothetical protein